MSTNPRARIITKSGFTYKGLTIDQRGQIYKCNNCFRKTITYSAEQKETLLDFGCKYCGNVEPNKMD